MDGKPTKCPIWSTPAIELSASRYRERITFDSPRLGGCVTFIGQAIDVVAHNPKIRLALTNWIIDQRRQGDAQPHVDREVVLRIKNAAQIGLTHNQRYENLLFYLEAASPILGAKLQVAGITNEEVNRRQLELLAWTGSTDPAEYSFLISQAEKAGLVEGATTDYIRLSLSGYNYIAVQRTKQVDSTQAFIAMWFDKSMNDIYEGGIEPAILDAGYKPLRIDRKEHSNKVDDEIIAEIRRSRFLVADFTSERDRPRGGVYFEAGFAQGLNLPVIWTCKSDLIDQLHFDTRQFNHIVWVAAADLRKALTNRIVAVVGPGPLKKN
jgi:hypothetical protein